MDPLTDVLSILRPQSLLWKHLVTDGDWAISFPSHGGTVFFLVAEGACVFARERHPTRAMQPGDFVLMNTPSPWRLGSAVNVAPTPIEDLRAGNKTGAARLSDHVQPRTRILGGGFTFANANADLIGDLLPSIVQVRADEPGATRLRTILDHIGEETAAKRPGQGLVVERLLDVLLVEVIRFGGAGQIEERPGLRKGLTDPAVATALHAFHANIAHGWTVAELARVAGLSRSVFAERFRLLVGVPPFEYLLRWRMERAKDAIRLGRTPLTQIAEDIGYQSLSAFSAAFRRTEGCSPKRFGCRARIDAGVDLPPR